jgi:hypothetical protein
MTILPGFLEVGIAFTRSSGHAGVGGKVIEVNVESIEFEARARNDKAKQKSSSGDGTGWLRRPLPDEHAA